MNKVLSSDMILWAISKGFYSKDDINKLNEVDEELISIAYDLHHKNDMIVSHHLKTINESKEEVIINYEGHIDEIH